MLADHTKPFHVVSTTRYAIECPEQSRQLKPAERYYSIHDKELLAMRDALIKFRVNQLDEQMFAVYTDNALLRKAAKSPNLSQRIARWLSLFAEYNFVVHYKPSKANILADTLLLRPDYVHAYGDEDGDRQVAS
ncbi:Retrotransposon Polyprotein [Phytophthora megakarya]|uniref:Retrotransposon Polyprotein n=1 Tax=Phytophthora megakarya TaxID=4795 RepID=A0A225VVV4_9STRA|nr:Retrotransposon Polyprotein [Phytophthora megakarya]